VAETRHSVTVLERYDGPTGEQCKRSLGEVRVSRLATLYKKVRFLTHENIGYGPITLPEQDLHTTAFWLSYEPSAVAGMSRAQLETALLGTTTALHQAACLLCMCDPRDLGTHAEVRGAAGPASRGLPASPLDAAPPREPDEYVAGFRPRRRLDDLGRHPGTPPSTSTTRCPAASASPSAATSAPRSCWRRRCASSTDASVPRVVPPAPARRRRACTAGW